ncbi:MAG: hypothetical protein M1831_007173 [Alyxoria varia]|nr:MAG: hypothetical protein M1831_007173 [Alyxoria varia]
MASLFQRRRMLFICLLVTIFCLTLKATAQDAPPFEAPDDDEPAPPEDDSPAPPRSADGASSADPTSAAPTSEASSAEPATTDPPSSTDATSATDTATTTDTDTSTGTTDSALPTLSGVLPPPLIVPDTSGAPFMQKSNLPEGTVFIGVGAVLGFLAASVLAWRGMVAWSLHRNVKKAASTTYANDSKTMFGGLSMPGGATNAGYTSMYNDSNMSLEQLSSAKTAYDPGAAAMAGSGGKRDSAAHYRHSKQATSQSHRNSRTPTSSSLFFSPTANGTGAAASGGAAQGSGTNSNRGSYMPAGYYASGSSAPNAGEIIAHLGGRRDSRGGYNRVSAVSNTSPPDSPVARPTSMRPGSVGSNNLLGVSAMNGSNPEPRRHSHHHLGVGSAGSASDMRRTSYEPRRHSRLNPNPRVSESDEGRRTSSSHGGGSNGLDVPHGGNNGGRGRTPSAYLDDLFEHHGNGPRERF